VETAAGDGVPVDNASREECGRGNEEKPRREHHRPVGEGASDDRAGQTGILGHVRSVLPFASDAVTPPYTAGSR
jgi:hypothetical protein